jgi:UDP-N-acetylmuramate dehydrogenase
MLLAMNTPPFDFARLDYPLAPCTLYNIGGPARVALLPRDEVEVELAFRWMQEQPGKKLILGGGSNVLIDDAGYDGIVLFTTELRRMEPVGEDKYYVGSGRELDDMLRNVMLEHNYEGVGGFTGIPGSVGGAIYMNAGTVKGSTCQWMESVEVMKPSGLVTVPMTPELYGYRGQTFCAPGDVILGGTFAFTPAEADQRAIYAHYKQRRLEKQPQGYCCGSVFKNPEGGHAGALIEACGLKGTRRGGAIISPMHANFIMNENNARFQDVLDLIALAKGTVAEAHGVVLEEEVRIIR